jgi:hypothetical protein
MGNIERSTDDWQPRPGEPHPVDDAFYKLAIKERDYERVKVDRLERQLAGAVDDLRVALDLLEHSRCTGLGTDDKSWWRAERLRLTAKWGQ